MASEEKVNPAEEKETLAEINTPTRGPMKGAPDTQTPAIEHPGQYTGTSPDQNQSQERNAEDGSTASATEGSPNQGTESR